MGTEQSSPAPAALRGTSPPTDGSGALPPGTTRLRRDECEALLASARVGRLAFVVAGWPTVLPVNYRLDGGDVVFRTGEGGKLLAVSGAARVAFQVDAFDTMYQSGWSVLLHGVAAEITDPGELGREEWSELRAWAGGPKQHLVRISVLEVSGRRLARAWAYPAPPP